VIQSIARKKQMHSRDNEACSKAQGMMPSSTEMHHTAKRRAKGILFFAGILLHCIESIALTSPKRSGLMNKIQAMALVPFGKRIAHDAAYFQAKLIPPTHDER
jgi:hypothetical protein